MNPTEQMEFKAGDLYNLSRETINAIQHQYDEVNIATIHEAFNNGEIQENEKDYLLSYYKDGMEVYRKAYRAVYELFGQPENTCAFDPETGRIDIDEKGQPINYGLKVLTPFVNTRLEYRDKNNNPIYVIFPKMKSAKRAIEKLKDEYRPECTQAMMHSFDRLYESEDREAFRESLQDIPHTINFLHDILRLTVTAKYKTDVERLMRKTTEKTDANFYISEQETRNRFEKPLEENEKQYYDIKMIMHLLANDRKDNIDVEMQLKINTLYHGDIQTHKIYEEVRSLEAINAKEKNKTTSKKNKVHIDALIKRITRTNQNRIHLYNMMVLDKARRIEDDGYIPLQAKPDFSDGTYRRCRDFITNEYMPESLDSFDGKTAFSADNDLNKLCFLRMAQKLPAGFNEFAEDASDTIKRKFAVLSSEDLRRFDDINKIAVRYQSSIEKAGAKDKPNTKVMLLKVGKKLSR